MSKKHASKVGLDRSDLVTTMVLHAMPAANQQSSDGQISDVTLIAGCVAGDSACFRPLVERHQRLAFSVALRMVGRPEDAEDVVQQAFVDAYAALDGFETTGHPHAVRAWLLRIVVNRAKDLLKSKRYGERQLEFDARPDQAHLVNDRKNPEDESTLSESRCHLEWALTRVPEKYRTALILRDVEELTYIEIQRILHLPITTLKIRVVRAREKMRGLLQEAQKGNAKS